LELGRDPGGVAFAEGFAAYGLAFTDLSPEYGPGSAPAQGRLIGLTRRFTGVAATR
jgi:hypothetical protein